MALPPEPERNPDIEAEHADGVHDGENVRMMNYCLDCFNMVDSMINDMLDKALYQ